MRYLTALSVVLMSLGIAEAAHAGECQDLAIKGDYTHAVVICRKAAETGDPSAQHTLGVMYYRGRGGVAQDHAEAMKWLRKAAEQGLAGAQTNLGLNYALGEGVAQDYELRDYG